VSKVSELLVEVTILTVLFCCSTVRYDITIWIFEYLGGPTFKWGGPISGERVLKNMPTPLFEQPLNSLPMGVFLRAYSTTVYTKVSELAAISATMTVSSLAGSSSSSQTNLGIEVNSKTNSDMAPGIAMPKVMRSIHRHIHQ